ncbi:MAG TPA: ATP-binding cassette domain-containing protein [Dehalococcoidales bacterium]|nr:ATP-binding cassette domain-containing protein [Dehalococcoidales bacterium]
MDMIEIEGLSRKFGKLVAVDNISFQVPRGEIFGFLGPNGAGKTTTINILCTLLKPSGGRASVNGYDVLKERREVQRSIGLVFQDPTLDDYLTADQNLRFHAYAYGVPANVREKRMQELMELVELQDRRKNKVSTYSGGMKRRLEIARGLLHHPSVLFLDEPTLGLDPQTRRRIWEHVLTLRQQEDLTIFLTTHYMDEAEHCERIAVIDNGRIIALDTPDNLKDSLGGDLVTLEAKDTQEAVAELKERHDISPEVNDGMVTFSVPHGDTFLPEFVRGFRSGLLSINVRRPTLDDVFLKLTGHAIRDQEVGMMDQMRMMMRSHG